MNKITEIAIFEIADSITDSRFIEIVNDLENLFHRHQPGYINCLLSKGKNNQWSMVMQWQTCDYALSASKNLMKSEQSRAFREAIIPVSVRILYHNLAACYQG